MKLIGLTGGIACGKSTVVAHLQEGGAHIVDCDAIVHELQRPDAPCVHAIARAFPAAVRRERTDGVDRLVLDRKALGDVVFSDPAARRRLGGIMGWPILRTVLARLLRLWWTLPADAVVVLDAPLLYETGTFLWFVSAVAVVAVSRPEEQIERLMARDASTQAAAEARVAAQMPLEAKTRRADHVLRNDGDKAALAERAARCLQWMRRWPNRPDRFRRALGVAAAAAAGVLGGAAYAVVVAVRAVA